MDPFTSSPGWCQAEPDPPTLLHQTWDGAITTTEDGAGWLAFWRSLTARGLSGGTLVTSDAHAGLVAAVGATLPGVAWQRCAPTKRPS